MTQTILDILQQTLGLPNSPVAQITVGARIMYADEFAGRLAEGLGEAQYGDVQNAIDNYECVCTEFCSCCKCDCADCEECG